MVTGDTDYNSLRIGHGDDGCGSGVRGLAFPNPVLDALW